MLALFSTMSGHILLCSLIMTAVFIVFILKNLFPVKCVIIWVLMFYLGVLNTCIRLKNVDELLSIAPINSEITGTIVSIPQGKIEGKPKFFFEVDRISFDGNNLFLPKEKVLVTIDNAKAQMSLDKLKLYNYGTLSGRLSTPFKAGNPSQFDYGNYLRNYDTYAVFYADKFLVSSTNLPVKAKFIKSINNYRERILNIHSKYLKTPNLEILGGIVFGDDAVSPPKDIKQSFVNSGLLHILAASGMNVAFIYAFFYMLMSIFRINYKAKVLLGMLTVILYTLMTGMGASVLRAAGMLLFVLAGKLIDRDAHSISLLFFVALLMLIYNPMYINDVGFQLSFIVTFGILIMSPAFARANNRVLDFILSTILIPIISQLWVIPVQIFYFNNISLYSVFANIMSVPILMILSFGGFVSSLLSIIAPIADFVCKIFDSLLNPLITLLVNISDFWGQLPNSSLQTTHPSVLHIILYYLFLVCLSGLLYKEFCEKQVKKILYTASFLLIFILIMLIPIKNTNLEIITFDVGNADSFLIKTPDNKYIMIDTGRSAYRGGKSQAEIIMLKYFKDKGIKAIDSIIVTHFDNDHCGGAEDLLNNLKVAKLYVNDLNHNSVAAENIYNTAKNRNTTILKADNDQQVYDKNMLQIKNFLPRVKDNDNDNSIITFLKYGDFKMLFTGDASSESIKSVLSDYIDADITVLKVPHHGAIGGLDKFLTDYLNPKYSIISVGENKFGHPNSYILALLNNSKILRTDSLNSIKIVVDKNKYKIYSFNSKSRKYKIVK